MARRKLGATPGQPANPSQQVCRDDEQPRKSTAALYTSEALREYAYRQIDLADTFLMIHREAGLNLCRCGRLHPCDDRSYWTGIRVHYQRLVGDGEPGGSVR
ncbi:hypothetical protein [Plantactinospora endophytica]|uniref:hypothetical protein n=1 Tax=Plantactinospora endophytica TaxID=673535 RepID=UPI001EF22C73|nr:hypothetical protein [Plantactinospora endophytica]